MDSNASEARGWRAFSLLWWHRICVEKIKINMFWGHLQSPLLRVHPCQREKGSTYNELGTSLSAQTPEQSVFYSSFLLD